MGYEKIASYRVYRMVCDQCGKLEEQTVDSKAESELPTGWIGFIAPHAWYTDGQDSEVVVCSERCAHELAAARIERMLHSKERAV